MWDAAKAMLLGKLISLSAHIRKCSIQWLKVSPLEAEKKKSKPKVNRKKETIKIRVGINEIGNWQR